jgi:endonuclease/exonuclease/phosphatase family metal-dependent hydrolase
LSPSSAAFSHAPPEHSSAGGRKDVTVMTRNLYLGASIGRVLGSSNIQEVIGNSSVLWGIVRASDIPGRMALVADEIVAAQPDLVGLQEVTLWRTQFPSDPGSPATTVAYDFLALLLDALAARGVEYVVADSVINFDAELPTITPGDPRFTDVRMTDRDVILARADLQTRNPMGAQYQTRIPITLGGAVPIVIPRGWTSVEAKVRGQWLRFVNTHLEVESPTVFGQVQVAQANELRQILAAESLPVILVGDINSDALGRTTASYGLLRAAGFSDAWSDANPGSFGFTSGHAEDLRNPVSAPASRIDVVLYRNGSGLLIPQSAALVGGTQKTAAGVWASDHLGVIATIRLGNPKFLP